MNKIILDDMKEFVEDFLIEQIDEAIQEYFTNGCMAMSDEEYGKMKDIAYNNFEVSIQAKYKGEIK